MMKIKDNRNEVTKRVAQFSFMTITKEKDITLGLRTVRYLISNPVEEIRRIRHPIDKLASTQTGTEIQNQKVNIIKIDQVTPGPTDPTTVSKPSKTSKLEKKTQILNTIRTFLRAKSYLHPTQFKFLTIRNKT